MASSLRLGFGIRSWSRVTFCTTVCTTRGARRTISLPLVSGLTPQRHLSLHEHYSLEMLSDYGVTVPHGELAYTPEQAKQIAEKLGGEAVIKAQVLAGGRGKGYFDSGLKGGVLLANSPEEIYRLASQMLGHRLITKQTGNAGRLCKKVLVCEKMKLNGEYYFAIVMDRAFKGPAMVASPYGGVNIEEVAKTSPSYIYKDAVDITTGMRREQAVNMAEQIGFSPECIDEAADHMQQLYKLLVEKDATMLEINPMVEVMKEGKKRGVLNLVTCLRLINHDCWMAAKQLSLVIATACGQFNTQEILKVVCMDAKLNFDDNAEYRQKRVFQLRDWSQEDPRDVVAANAGINYIGLTGSIGCLVNGAGLAMATMDIIKLYGGFPANFLDIGGGASAKEVMDGFRIFNSDSQVRAIFVNIFGGIIRCDEIAKGIVAAANEINIRTPIVIRLQGNNQKKAKALIESSGLRMLAVEDFDKAAQTVVNVSKIAELAHDVSIAVDFAPL